MPKYLDSNGLLYFWQKIKAKFLTSVDYDATNKKLTKTLGGNKSDIVSVSTIKTDLNFTKDDIGLGNVDNTSDANKPISTATQTALDAKAASDHVHGDINNDGTISASAVTVASSDAIVIVDNTNKKVVKSSIAFGSSTTKCLTQKGTWADFNKYTHPTSTAADPAAVKIGRDAAGHVLIGEALVASDVGAIASSSIGAANGVCPLNANSLIDSQYLPSFVDDIVEAYARSGQTALSST